MTEAIVNVGEEQPVGKGFSSGSRPTGTAGDIFDKMQNLASAKGAAKPADEAKEKEIVAPPPKADGTDQALADAGKAPAEKAPEKVEEKTGEKAKKPSIRAIVKASNIPAEDKDAITNLAYMGFALHELGITPETVKLFKEQGVTPETIEERIKLHPTVDDAKRDAWYAAEMRRVANDYHTDPVKFLLGLKQSAASTPGVFPNLITAASAYLKDEARPTWVSILNDGFQNALFNLGQEAVSGGDEETQAAVAIVQAKFGFTPSGAVTKSAPAESPELIALRQKNAELEARQKQEAEASKEAFLQSVVTEARNAVYREIDSRWRKAAVAGLTEAETKRAIDDVFYAVEGDLASVANFVYDMNAKRNGPQTEQAFREAVKYAYDRALPFIPKHQKAALEFWTPRALAAAEKRDTTEKKAAAQEDAAAAGGAATVPAKDSPSNRLKDLKGRKDLTFREKFALAMNK